jgi:UTP--glucose-1-phosphate uridylyltransferase
MNIRKVVIPVAGLGTRLLPATKSQPKEMLPVGRKPVVQYVVEEMIEQDITNIMFITGRDKRTIEDHFDRDPELASYLAQIGEEQLLDETDYEKSGARFFYTRQLIPKGRHTPAGIGDAVMTARDFISAEPFVVAFGDTIIRSGNHAGLIRRMIKSHSEHESCCTIAVTTVDPDEVSQYGIVSPVGRSRADFEIDDIIEKPTSDEAPSRLAVAGRYIFNPEIFDAIEQTPPGNKGEVELTDAIRNLIKKGRKVRCVHLKKDEHRYDIGNPESYFRSFIDFALSDQQYGYRIRQYFQQRLRDF